VQAAVLAHLFVHHSALPVRSEAALQDAREAVRVVVRAEAAHPLTRRVVHEVMEVLREQRSELGHARELFALVCGRVHSAQLAVLCTPVPAEETAEEAEEAWASRRRRSTMMTDSSLTAPSVTASEEAERLCREEAERRGRAELREEEEQDYRAGITEILSRLA
jgi:hypothetical protein